jgi:predicted ester cyclase
MIADDVIAHGLTDENGEVVRGKEDFRRFFTNFRSAFPDVHVELGETVCDGDKMAAVCRVTASHAGPGLGFVATNNKVEFSGILMVRLRDDKIIEAWNYYDFMSMFGQLGVLSITPPDAGGAEPYLAG